jgi:hypothetical protein
LLSRADWDADAVRDELRLYGMQHLGDSNGVLVVPPTVRHILAWSQWRRRHQSVAQYDHYKRREVLVEAVAA